MIKTVFFDLDDTLYNTSRIARLARMAAIISMISKGLPLSVEEGYDLLIEIVKEKGSNYNGHFDILVERVIGKKDHKIISAGIIGYHNTKFANMVPFNDTISTLIELKKRGIELNIISNGLALKQWDKILRLGLEAFFDHVLISEIIGLEKPDMDIYKKALEMTGFKPNEALFVDNDIKCLEGAKESGMYTVLMNRVSHHDCNEFCDFEIFSLKEILSVLEKI